MAKKISLSQKKEEAIEDKMINSTTEFLKSNIKILIVLLLIPIGVLGYYFGYVPYKEKQNLSAQSEMYNAIYYFEEEKFEQALNGDGINPGFLEIKKKYGNSKAGQLCSLYLGVIHLKKGEYEDAIKRLSEYNNNDYVLKTRSLENIGDAYSQQGKYKQAASKYLEAAKYKPSESYTPSLMIKASECYLKAEDAQNCLTTLKEILKKYPKYKEINEVKKRILKIDPEAKI